MKIIIITLIPVKEQVGNPLSVYEIWMSKVWKA